MCGREISLAGKLSFRVPLYSKDGEFVVGDAFDDAVVSGLDDPEFPPGSVYGLMVGAVGDHTFPIELSKKRVFPHGGGMQLISIFPRVFGGFFDMLGNRSSEINVDDLHSLAYAENRFPGFIKDIQRLQLYDIQFNIDISGTMVFLAEKGRGNIPAAGEQEGVHIGKLSGIHGRQIMDAHSVQGFFIIQGIFASSYDGSLDTGGIIVIVKHDATPFCPMLLAVFYFMWFAPGK